MAEVMSVEHEIVHPDYSPDDWHLALQFGEFKTAHGKVYMGYQIVCRRSKNAKPEAVTRIPSLKDIEIMMDLARKAGWGNEAG